MYNNFKVGFEFLFNRAIELNIQLLYEFKTFISKLWSSVYGRIFQQIKIWVSVIKQKIINDVQQF